VVTTYTTVCDTERVIKYPQSVTFLARFPGRYPGMINSRIFLRKKSRMLTRSNKISLYFGDIFTVDHNRDIVSRKICVDSRLQSFVLEAQCTAVSLARSYLTGNTSYNSSVFALSSYLTGDTQVTKTVSSVRTSQRTLKILKWCLPSVRTSLRTLGYQVLPRWEMIHACTSSSNVSFCCHIFI